MNSYNGFTPYQRAQGDKVLKEAIARGEIADPMTQPCCICGQDKGIRHLHCEDYSPDKIVQDSRVVCWRCHMMIHTRYKHPLSFAKYMMQVTLYKQRFTPVYRPNDWETLEQHYTED